MPWVQSIGSGHIDPLNFPESGWWGRVFSGNEGADSNFDRFVGCGLIGEKEMSEKEKIYLQNDDVTVSASRVVLGDKSFILRNISAVQLYQHKLLWLPKSVWNIGMKVFSVLAVLAFIQTPFQQTTRETEQHVVMFLVLGAFAFLFSLGRGISEKYYVQVSTGGTSDNALESDTKDLPEQVVEAINAALLDLDDLTSTSSTGADEIKKFKDLLDADAITQEEFEAKKKELLDL